MEVAYAHQEESVSPEPCKLQMFEFLEALKLSCVVPGVLERGAWCLAVSPEPSEQDGKQAPAGHHPKHTQRLSKLNDSCSIHGPLPFLVGGQVGMS